MRTITFFALMSLASAFPVTPHFLYAQEHGVESFYDYCIDSKVDRCLLQASRKHSRSEEIRKSAERAQRQADFYRMHKDELIREMVDRDIGFQQHQVDYFLNKSFTGR